MSTRRTEGTQRGVRLQARTRLARRAVIDAARQLFVERGYGATTVDAISELAEVPPATLYRLFASKHGVLKALLDISIVGDDEATPMADRPAIRQLLAETDPRAMLAGFAKVTTQLNSRVGPLYRVLLSAAGSDPDAAALLEQLTRQRQTGQQLIARSLLRTGSLAAGLRERDAADIIHALMSPELHQLLVHDRHWKPDRYQRWLANTLEDQLLGSTRRDGGHTG